MTAFYFEELATLT